jgi:predicted nucleotide-binding protein (sugar kinase/HSP70/actin superfamily)
VALLTQRKLRKSGASTGFAGLDVSRRKITLRKTRCDLCDNECRLTFANIEGRSDEPSWGYMCGRDPDAKRMKVSREYDLFRKRRRWLWHDGAAMHNTTEGRRRPIVGFPRALTTFSQLPLYRRLLEELGAEVILTSESTRQTRERGAAMTAADFCFPVKLGHGQIAEALERDRADFLFVPHFVAQPPLSRQSNTFLCPYVQAFPRVVTTALEAAGIDPSRVLAPIIDRRLSFDRQVRLLHGELGRPLRVGRERMRRAWEAARMVQDGFEKRFSEAGLRALEGLEADMRSNAEARPGIVIIGRPYNVVDPSVNLDLPRKISEMGYRVFPMDALPFDPLRIREKYQNLFWAYGQRIVSALELVRRREDLFAIYFTNFNCGPDSFLLSYAEEIMGDKPMLSLELDEHGADGGYITRIEAFLDVTRSWRVTPPPTRPAPVGATHDELRERRIWIPPIHPVGSRLGAAAFREDGYDAMSLPNESHADLEVGQKLTRGCECLPMRTTIGAFLNAAEQDESGCPNALFMPTAKGPCRFGQYNTLERLIFDRIGRTDTLLLSPSSDNNYYGLPELVRRRFYEALLASDALFKATCRVRPYEITSGDTDQTLEKWSQAAERCLEEGRDLKAVLRRAGGDFIRIPTRDERRPLIGVVGEIYVRSNVFSNENLVRAIEDSGGESWITPLTEWLLFTAFEDVRRLFTVPKSVGEALTNGRRFIRSYWMQSVAHAFMRAMGPVVADRPEPRVEDTLVAGQRYLPFNIGGEAILSLGRAVQFVHQGAAMVVNASPFSCMAGTVCAALFAKMEKELQIPIVNCFYDGRGEENARLPVFLANLDRSAARAGPPRVSRKSGFSLRKNPFARELNP